MQLVEDMCAYKENPIPEMKHGGNHHEWADYDLAGDGMEIGVADVETPVNKYNLESEQVDQDDMPLMTDDAPIPAPATKYGAEIKKDGGSVWDRERYSTSAKKYRRGGESLTKYQIEGEVKEKPLTELEKTKKHRSFTGEYYGGPLSSHEIQDFWCFECDNYTIQTKGGWREGMDPNVNPEVDKWRSSKGFSVWDLLNFHYHTQMNIPYAVTNLPEGMSNIDLTDRSTWEGKNYGYIRENSPTPMGTSGVPGHPYENESFYPKSHSQAHAMARDLRKIYPGVVIPYYFYEGEPYNIVEQDEIDAADKINRSNVAHQRAYALHDQILSWFNNDTYLHEMGIINPRPGDVKRYLDKWINAEYTYTDEFGNSTTLKDTDMPEFLKKFKEENGFGLYDDLIKNYDTYYSSAVDLKDLEYNTSVQDRLILDLEADPNLIYGDIGNNGGITPPMMDARIRDLNSMNNLPKKGFYVNGKWYPQGTHVLSADTRSDWERDRDARIMADREKKQNLANLMQMNTNFSLGKSRMDQDWDGYQRWVDAPYTYEEMRTNLVNNTPGLNSAVYNGLLFAGTGAAYTQPIKWINNLSKVNRVSKVRSVSTVGGASSFPKIAANPVTYGDALNVGYATLGTVNHGPALIQNIQEGDAWGTVGHGLGLGLHYIGVPSTFKNVNRLMGGKQYNRFPVTTAAFQKEFPNISKHQLNLERPLNAKIYDNIYGPAIGNMPRFNILGPSQNTLLKNVKKYERNFFSPYQDVTNAPNFMPNLIKKIE